MGTNFQVCEWWMREFAPPTASDVEGLRNWRKERERER